MGFALLAILSIGVLNVSAQPSPDVQAAITANIKTQAAAQARGSVVDWTTHVLLACTLNYN